MSVKECWRMDLWKDAVLWYGLPYRAREREFHLTIGLVTGLPTPSHSQKGRLSFSNKTGSQKHPAPGCWGWKWDATLLCRDTSMLLEWICSWTCFEFHTLNVVLRRTWTHMCISALVQCKENVLLAYPITNLSCVWLNTSPQYGV